MATVQQIYIAIFGRPADPVGLAYWNEQTNNGEDLAAMIAAFTAAPEYQERFEGQTNEEIISSIYQSLFGREPDAEGLEFYADALASGELPIETIAVRILDGAQNEDQTSVENKTEVANLFTASLDTPEEINGYVGEDAANEAADFLSTVNEDPDSVPTEDEIDEIIEQVNSNNYPDPEPETPDEGAPPSSGGSGGDDDDGNDPGPTLEEQAAEIYADWTELDTNYTDYYIDEVNEAFVRLGVRYAEYLEDGGEVLTDIRVKNDDSETRDQSLHDNLLGNLNQVNLEDRNLPDEKEAELIDLIEGVNAGLLYRPTEDGSPPTDFSAADAWDMLNGIPRPDLAETPADISDTDLIADRAAPASWSFEDDLSSVVVVTDPLGEDDPSAFARYQGIKADADGEPYDVNAGAVLSFDFNVETEWSGDENSQVAGLWVQMQNEEGTLPSGGNFSIAEYVDADAATELDLGGIAGFRFWNGTDGWSEVVAYEEAGDATLTFAFTDNAHVWFLNGDEVYTDTGPDVGNAEVIEGLIFNAQNFGDVAETYIFSDISLSGVAPVEDFIS